MKNFIATYPFKALVYLSRLWILPFLINKTQNFEWVPWDKKATEGPESRVRRELPLHSSCIKERRDCAQFMKTWADICLPQSSLIQPLGHTFLLDGWCRKFFNIALFMRFPRISWIRIVSSQLWFELCPSLNNWAVKHIVIYRSSSSGQWMRIFHGTCDGEVEHKLWSCIGAKK